MMRSTFVAARKAVALLSLCGAWTLALEKRYVSDPIIPLTDPAYALDLVRSTFKQYVEQKVGIAVNFRRKTKPTAFSIKGAGPAAFGPTRLSEQQIEDIYGIPDFVNI